MVVSGRGLLYTREIVVDRGSAGVQAIAQVQRGGPPRARSGGAPPMMAGRGDTGGLSVNGEQLELQKAIDQTVTRLQDEFGERLSVD